MFVPLLIVVLIIIGILFLSEKIIGWYGSRTVLHGPQALATFSLDDQTNMAQVIVDGKPFDVVYGERKEVFKKEGIETGVDSRVAATLESNDIARIDGNSRVLFDQKGSSLLLSLEKGNVWIKGNGMKSDISETHVTTPHINVTSSDIVSFGLFKTDITEKVVVFKGSVTVEVTSDDGKTQRLPLTLGQELSLVLGKDTLDSSITMADKVAVISSESKSHPFTIWNLKLDGDIAGKEGEDLLLNSNTNQNIDTANADLVTVNSSYINMVTNKDTVDIKGTYDKSVKAIRSGGVEASLKNGTFILRVKLADDGINNITITADTDTTSDTTVERLQIVKKVGDASAPVVTYPREGSTVSEETLKITGSVADDIDKVYVDGYALQKYVPGSKQWTYYASIANGNLVSGKNIFTVYTVDKAGNKSPETSLTFTYTPSATSSSSSTNTNSAKPKTGTGSSNTR